MIRNVKNMASNEVIEAQLIALFEAHSRICQRRGARVSGIASLDEDEQDIAQSSVNAYKVAAQSVTGTAIDMIISHNENANRKIQSLEDELSSQGSDYTPEELVELGKESGIPPAVLVNVAGSRIDGELIHLNELDELGLDHLPETVLHEHIVEALRIVNPPDSIDEDVPRGRDFPWTAQTGENPPEAVEDGGEANAGGDERGDEDHPQNGTQEPQTERSENTVESMERSEKVEPDREDHSKEKYKYNVKKGEMKAEAIQFFKEHPDEWLCNHDFCDYTDHDHVTPKNASNYLRYVRDSEALNIERELVNDNGVRRAYYMYVSGSSDENT